MMAGNASGLSLETGREACASRGAGDCFTNTANKRFQRLVHNLKAEADRGKVSDSGYLGAETGITGMKKKTIWNRNRWSDNFMSSATR